MTTKVITLAPTEYEEIPATTGDPDQVYSLAELAQQVVNDAMKPNVAIDVRVDALKALTTYHLGVLKAGKGKKSEDDDETAKTFVSIKDRIRQAG